MRKRLLIIAGTVFTAIGIVGIFIPILPTTPFLLLAAACYLRGSEKFYHWLLHNRLFGFYIKNYIEGKGMPLKMKLFTLILLWLSIGISIWIGTQNLAIRIILALVAVGVTVHIITIKKRTTNKINPNKGDIDILDKQSITWDAFDQIAPAWYNFRHRTIFQTELDKLALRWRRGKLLNVGCAHGPDFLPFKESFELYGADYSSEMLKLAQKYAEKYKFNVNLQEADARRLPYENNYFDFAIAIAVYHHIEDKDGRTQALKELYRVLKPGGEAFITAWNKWQPRFWFKGKNTMVPWKSKAKTLYRFYYLFTYHEFEQLARQAGFEVLKSFPEARYKFPIKAFSRNICLLVKKS